MTADGLLLELEPELSSVEPDPELFSLELEPELSSLDPPLAELPWLEPLEDVEDPAADFVPVDAALDALVLVRSDELEVVAALRFAAAASAGSWPETSCT